MTTPLSFQDPRNNPLLRDVERVSPAISLDLIVGYEVDEDGWEFPIFRSYRVGEIMLTSSGNTWRVVGFTLDNLVICSPHGLGHDKAIRSVIFKHEALDYAPIVETLRHRDSLI